MEPTVLIRCREADLDLVEGVLPAAIEQYSAAMNKPCQISISKDNFLSADA